MFDRTLVLASRNEGKILEFEGLLSGFAIEIKSLKDFGPIPEVIEDGETFEDNAYKKASFTSKALGYPSLADDSGLMVEALNGAPGIRSARYAGDEASDWDNNLKLLADMSKEENRKAVFICSIIIAVPSGPALTYEGRCEGEITRELTGEKGFGYDPLFYYPPLKKTFAQMTPEEKNAVSHRGKAMAELRSEFDKVMIWLKQRMAEEPFAS
jgi:XTP/dITP diphosphohydrolase